MEGTTRTSAAGVTPLEHTILSGAYHERKHRWSWEERELAVVVEEEGVLRQRTDDYRDWVEAYARNHSIPMEWAEKGLRKEDYVLPALHRMEKRGGPAPTI